MLLTIDRASTRIEALGVWRFFLVVAIVLLHLVSANAFAQPTSSPSVEASVDAPHAALATPSENAVKLLGTTVFTIHVARSGQSAEKRALDASRVLESATRQPELAEVVVDDRGDVAIIFVGTTPLVQLGPEDAREAGDASLGIHAASIAAKVRDVLAKEHSRNRLATRVFSFSLLIFSGLIALALLRKVREFTEKARSWISQNPDRLPGLHLRGIEFVRPRAFRGALSVLLGVTRVVGQIGIAYTWVLLALSSFESTKGYTDRLTGYVLTPLYALMGRIAGSVPLLVIAFVATLAIAILVRFVGLFFGSVARGETTIAWLPSDLADATGVLIRFGIIVAAVVFAAPLVTGAEEGSLARTGIVFLVSIGLATTPLLASAVVGMIVVYDRRFRAGDIAEIGNHVGRVREVTLLDVRLEDESGCQIRIPHLLCLVRPTRILGRTAHITIDIGVDAKTDLDRARDIIVAAGQEIGTQVQVSLIRVDDTSAHLHASMISDAKDGRTSWLISITKGMSEAQIGLRPLPLGAKQP